MTRSNVPRQEEEAVVNPVVDKRSPKLGSWGLMISPEIDLNHCRRELDLKEDDYLHLYLSRLYGYQNNLNHPVLVGPMVGAPYAVMVLETLIAWGCHQIIFYGWCGSIDPSVRIGDIIIPDKAIIDEGTSHHYLGNSVTSVDPSPALTNNLTMTFEDAGIRTWKGAVWTTDGVFRETKNKVSHYQTLGVLGVEMELSALLSVAVFRQADVAGCLVVSDELGSLKWKPGFKTEMFKKGRMAAAKGLLSCLKRLPTLSSTE